MGNMTLDENVFVKMRDGVKLAVDIFRPNDGGKHPALVSMSPYGKERQRYPGGYYLDVEAGDTAFFVSRGYTHVIADSRGSFPSQGSWNLTDAAEQLDGYDLVEWVAQQPWCDGNVAMVGESYYAAIQYLVAATQPPHLKTIVPFDGWSDPYRDVVYHGGLFNQGFMAYWIALTYERIYDEVISVPGVSVPPGCLPPGPVLMDVITRHTTDGPYYWERAARTKFDRIKIPIYHLCCAAHYVHMRGQLLAYSQINTPKKLLVSAGSPWRFTYSLEGNQEIARWLDYWLKGVDTGIMSEPPVTLYLPGSGEWRFENEYPLARTKWTNFYLHGGEAGPADHSISGSLDGNVPAAETPNSYRYPYAQRLVEANQPVLGFCTEPLPEDMEVVGPASLVSYASLDVSDAAWIVKIDDVSPDGSFRVVSQGWLRASHREIDPALSKPGQPFHPHLSPVPVIPGEVTEYQLEIWPIFRVFKAGHRLRLRVQSSDSRNFDVRPHHSTFGRPLTATVHHSRDYPSHLLLPVIPAGPPAKVRPAITFVPGV